MALSDCEKCWETPCMCGHDYKTMPIKRVIQLRDTLNKVIADRAQELVDESWSGPNNR